MTNTWPPRSTPEERHKRRLEYEAKRAAMTPEERAVSEANVARFLRALTGPHPQAEKPREGADDKPATPKDEQPET